MNLQQLINVFINNEKTIDTISDAYEVNTGDNTTIDYINDEYFKKLCDVRIELIEEYAAKTDTIYNAAMTELYNKYFEAMRG